MSGKASAAIRSISRGYGINFTSDGDLHVVIVQDSPTATGSDASQARFGRALLRLCAAMLQVDALRALQVAPREPYFAKQLTSLLVSDDRLIVTPRSRVVGNTGKPYKVTAAVGSDPSSLVLVQAIVKATSTDMRNVDHTFRMFSDVNGPVHPGRKISVLADDPREYDQSDIKLLKKVSLVATWAQRSRLISYLIEPFEVEGHRLYDEDPEMFATL